MFLSRLKSLFIGDASNQADDLQLSRRKFLIGAGAVTAVLAVPSLLDNVSAAHAAVGEPGVAPDAEMDETVQTAQIILRRNDRNGGRNNRNGGRNGGRNNGRNRGRNSQRMSRRDLERRCRQNRGFRRNNRNLCNRVTGRSFGRRNTCIQIGPFQVCE